MRERESSSATRAFEQLVAPKPRPDDPDAPLTCQTHGGLEMRGSGPQHGGSFNGQIGGKIRRGITWRHEQGLDANEPGEGLDVRPILIQPTLIEADGNDVPLPVQEGDDGA
jgi:hypothetical protein